MSADAQLRSPMTKIRDANDFIFSHPALTVLGGRFGRMEKVHW
jgi:hypothetical protein